MTRSSRGKLVRPHGARLRWLGFALSAAALVTALWTVTRMVADHDRAAPAADTSTRP